MHAELVSMYSGLLFHTVVRTLVERDPSGCGATRPFRHWQDEAVRHLIEDKLSLMRSGTCLLLLPLFSKCSFLCSCIILFVLTIVYRCPEMSFHRLYNLTTTTRRTGERWCISPHYYICTYCLHVHNTYAQPKQYIGSTPSLLIIEIAQRTSMGEIMN